MRFKADCRGWDSQHVQFRVFDSQGANCGQLTIRTEDALTFAKEVWRGDICWNGFLPPDAEAPPAAAPVPYIGFGNETLRLLPDAKAGDRVTCPHCGGAHLLEASKGDGPTVLLFYKCGEKSYLGGVNGKLVVGQKPDVSGKL